MSHALLVTEVGVTRDPETFSAVFARVEALAKVGGALLLFAMSLQLRERQAALLPG
jgi:hypothetical protein